MLSPKRLGWIVVVVGLTVLVVRSFRPVPVLVDVGKVARGPLLVTVDDDGRTRVRERYTISAPIQGRLLRTPLRAGDPVAAGVTRVAEFEPIAPDLLDPRSLAQAQARLQRSGAAVREAQARREQAAAELRYAANELERIRGLRDQDVASQEQLERAQRDERRAREGLRAAGFGEQVANFERELAVASLREVEPEDVVEQGELVVEPTPPDSERRLEMRSPIDGAVLRVFEESSRTLVLGTPILEVGDTGFLEVIADYLSQDAVRVRPGMLAIVEGWGGQRDDGTEERLEGRVRVIEPAGFTKISALGVEEQRVNVIVDPVGDRTQWSALGDGYRVELRIVLWQADDVLVVPAGALFRGGAEWFAYRVTDGRAHRCRVEIGRRNGLEAQVIAGLEEGDSVILYPSDLVADEARVEAR